MDPWVGILILYVTLYWMPAHIIGYCEWAEDEKKYWSGEIEMPPRDWEDHSTNTTS